MQLQHKLLALQDLLPDIDSNTLAVAANAMDDPVHTWALAPTSKRAPTGSDELQVRMEPQAIDAQPLRARKVAPSKCLN